LRGKEGGWGQAIEWQGDRDKKREKKKRSLRKKACDTQIVLR
jgi:hypothetical protein